MKRPTPEQLLDFFKFIGFSNDDEYYEEAISEFYKRFDPQFDHEKYHEIGIHIDRIIREPYLIEEGNVEESKTVIYFYFEKNATDELSFTLWGAEEEESFLLFDKQELIQFFELRFRRFSKLLSY